MTGQLILNIRLRDEATFANYVGEAGDRLKAAKNLAYVWGYAESGRSHLLQAECHAARQQGQSTIYVENPADHDALVLDGLESVPVICIDNIDQIQGHDDWERALFHLINGVNDAGGRLVLSGDVAARFLQISLKDLHSRLLAAATVQTDQLSDEQKLQFLQQRARIRGFVLPTEVGRFILGRSPRGMRSLSEMLERLESESLVRQRKVTIPLAKDTLGI